MFFDWFDNEEHIISMRSIPFGLLFYFYSIFWFVKFENEFEKSSRQCRCNRMVDINESNISNESGCKYFKRKFTIVGLILHGLWVSPIRYNCQFLAESHGCGDDNAS